jgi:hypothetical protein
MYDIDSSTHIAKYIPNTEEYYSILNNSLQGVDITNIFRFSKMCGYSMYELTSIDDSDKKVYYAIEQKDFVIHWNIKPDTSKLAHIQDSRESFLYVCITETIIQKLLNTVPTEEKNGAFTYFLYRTLFPEDISIFEKVKKRIEFEAGYQLFKILSHRMLFKHQANFLNFKADMILELKDVLGGNLPKIGVEIDEDGHPDKCKDIEKHRQNVLEYFDNMVFRISIKSTSTLEQIECEVVKTSKLITEKVDDLLLTYNPEIDIKALEKQALEAMIPIEHITLFLADHKTGDINFPYRHDLVAKELGYSDTKNSRRFKELIRNKYPVNIGYKIIELFELDARVGRATRASPLKIDILGRINKGGTKIAKIYLLSRITINRICIDSSLPKAKEIAHSFAKIYEIFQKFLIGLRQKVVNDNRNHKAYEPDIKKRVEVLSVQKFEKSGVTKKSEKYKKCKKELDDKNIELEDIKNKNIELEDTIKDITLKWNTEKTKNDTLELAIKDIKKKLNKKNEKYKDLDLENLNTKYAKIKIRYKNSKTNLKYALQEKNDMIEKHNTYTVSTTEKISEMEKLLNKNIDDIKKYIETINKKTNENIDLNKIIKKYTEENNNLKKFVEDSGSDSDSDSDNDSDSGSDSDSDSDSDSGSDSDSDSDSDSGNDSESKSDNDSIIEPKIIEPIITNIKIIKPKYTAFILKTKLKSDLTKICQDNGLHGHSNKNKDGLINFILTHKNMQ